MKAVLILFCLVFAYTSSGGTTGKPVPAEEELMELALIYRLKEIGSKLSPGDPTLIFVSASKESEARVRAACRYDWLRPADTFAMSRDGIYRLRSERNRVGYKLSAEGFEIFQNGWRCSITIYSGPLGCSSLRCYFRREGSRWIVEKVVEDDSLPVS